jgi:hypothetical protein
VMNYFFIKNNLGYVKMSKVSCSTPYRSDGTGGPSPQSLEKAIWQYNPDAKVLKSGHDKKQLCNYMTKHGLKPAVTSFSAEDLICGANHDPRVNFDEKTIRAKAKVYNTLNPTNKIYNVPVKNKTELCHSLRKRGQTILPVKKSPSSAVPPILFTEQDAYEPGSSERPFATYSTIATMPSDTPMGSDTPMASAPPMDSDTPMASAPPMLSDLQRCSMKHKPELHNSHLVDLRKLATVFNKTQPEENRIQNVPVLSKPALCSALQNKGQPINMECTKKHSRRRSTRRKGSRSPRRKGSRSPRRKGSRSRK